MKRTFVFMMLGAGVLSGCIEGPRGLTQLPLELGMTAEALSVRVRVEGAGPIKQGQSLPVHIAVSNISHGPVILRDAEIWVGHCSSLSDWRPRVYGSITYDEAGDLYRHNEVAQMEAVMAQWSDGLLLPGESDERTTSVEVIEEGALRSGCRLAYYAGTFDDMAPSIYLEREREGVNVIYGPSTPDQLRALAAKEEPFWRRVIHRSQSEPLLLETQATLHVAAAPLSLHQAMSRAGLWPPEDFAYSEKEGGWVLEGPDGVALVTLAEVKKYPGCTVAVWEFIERSTEEVYFWYLVDDSVLHGLFREMGYVLQEGKGFHAYVRPSDALVLIEKAHDAGYMSQMSEFQFTPCISFEPLTPKTAG